MASPPLCVTERVHLLAAGCDAVLYTVEGIVLYTRRYIERVFAMFSMLLARHSQLSAYHFVSLIVNAISLKSTSAKLPVVGYELHL